MTVYDGMYGKERGSVLMSDLTDRVKKFGTDAISKAGDVIDTGKYKAKIAREQAEIEKLEQQIGKHIYEKFKENEEDEVEYDQEVMDTCAAIDATYDEIALLETKIEELKSDE